MRIDDVIKAWDTQADEYNQWDALDADERVNFTLQQANNEIDLLRAELENARELVIEWGAYASEYFQEKYDLAGDIARLDAALPNA